MLFFFFFFFYFWDVVASFSYFHLHLYYLYIFFAFILIINKKKALEQIPNLNLTPEGLSEANLLIYEQKYMDLIEEKKVLEALEVLRVNIRPFIGDTEKLHKLASLIMCQSQKELYEKLGIESKDEAKKQLLLNIGQKCKPESMIEPNRLENLLSQALTYQMVSCKFHSKGFDDASQFSLIEQHKCQCEETPAICEKSVKDKDEIWNLKFSPDGEKIASVCKKATLSVWDFNINTLIHPVKIGKINRIITVF